MITKKQLIERHNKRVEYARQKNSRYASIPTSMFINNKWNENNWNGGDGVIRQFTKWLEYNDQKYYNEFDYLNYGYEMVAAWNYFEDITYVNINLRKYCHDDLEADFTFDTYLISYYKDRGKTDCILHNGKQVNFDEYVHLLNIIEASGFKFKLDE